MNQCYYTQKKRKIRPPTFACIRLVTTEPLAKVSQPLAGVKAFHRAEKFSGQDDVALSELQVFPAFGNLLHGSEALQLPLLPPALLPQRLQLPAQFVKMLHQMLYPLLLLHHVVQRVVVVAGYEDAHSQGVLLF